jgi:hypothetical protein
MTQTLDGPIVINGTLEVKGASTLNGDFSASGIHIRFPNGNIFAAGEIQCSDVKTGDVTTDQVFCRQLTPLPNVQNTITTSGGFVCEGHFVNTGGNVEVRIGDVIIRGNSLLTRLQTLESAAAESLSIAKAAQTAVANLQSAVTIANALGAKVTQLQNSVDTLGKQQTQQLASLEAQIGALSARING